MMKEKFKSLVKEILVRMRVLPPLDGYVRNALALAERLDCDRADLDKPQQHPERVAPMISDRVCNWYVPYFANASYGGIMTILRLAAHLQEVDGVRQRFLICGAGDLEAVKRKMRETFPALLNAEVRALDSQAAIDSIPPSDYSVATLWTTAYLLLKVQNTGYKFSMVQDYEPELSPAGTTSALAQLTYRFGFYGIANTQSVRDIYEQQYEGRAVTLSPSVDTTIFYPGPDLPSEGRLRLFCYARPGVRRNCFELAAAAFRIVKKRLGDQVEIICAGESWKPQDYGLEGQVKMAGLLPYAQTGDLYRSCHVGLSMMMTRHPSYIPFELMACGTLVVANRNAANAWFLKDGENCLISEPTASCLAETLIDALLHYDTYAPLRRRAAAMIRAHHGDWTASLQDVAAFMHKPERCLSREMVTAG